jgi:hypothetical protein
VGVSTDIPRDVAAIAEQLNRSCHCIAVDPVALRAHLESSPETTGVYATILKDQPHLFSGSPVFLARATVDRMQAVIAAIEAVVRNRSFVEHALGEAPSIADTEHGPRGVFLGYDFHLGKDGPKLIEINTNAGGALLNAALAGAQQACCEEVSAVLAGSVDPVGVRSEFVEMFVAEWRLQRGDGMPERIAIVDEEPTRQYLYPEFLLFREMFRAAGMKAEIVDVDELRHETGALLALGRRIDLVYNRLTDFYFETPRTTALRSAYAAGDVVVTPHPRAYALRADKRLLPVLSDAPRLRDWGVEPDVVALLAESVPEARLVTPEIADELWRDRRKYFFKPATGFGSKAAYRGDKLTRTAWEHVLSRPYIAQRIVAPSERTIAVDGREVPLKLDLRNYVYEGRVQMVAARLYQGQTTNFRTVGGGFAPVFTEAAKVGPQPACN